ncbi:MAG: lipocalin family protein [Ferruginibacter sp.]
MKKMITALLLLSPVLFSCKKDKKNCDLNSGNIVGSYKVTAAIFHEPGSTPVNDFATWDACEQDDITVLNANGTANINDVGTVCTTSGSGVTTWSLSGDQFTFDGELYTVTAFDCSGTTLVHTESTGATYTLTLAKQ